MIAAYTYQKQKTTTNKTHTERPDPNTKDVGSDKTENREGMDEKCKAEGDTAAKTAFSKLLQVFVVFINSDIYIYICIFES